MSGTLAVSINTGEIDIDDIAAALAESLAQSPQSDYAAIINPKTGHRVGFWNTKGIIPSED